MTISIEELTVLIQKDRARLNQMQLAQEYGVNILNVGKYFRYKNNEKYDPWFTYVKVLSMEKTSRFAIVISFEKNLQGQCVYWAKYKRKVKTLGEEISQDEFEDEFAKFNVTVRHFAISVNIGVGDKVGTI